MGTKVMENESQPADSSQQPAASSQQPAASSQQPALHGLMMLFSANGINLREVSKTA
jgi:hypothetical protein